MTYMDDMGGLFEDQNRMGEAENVYREVLKGRREKMGPKSVSTLKSAFTLGALLKDSKKGELDEAELLLEEAKNGCAQKLGPQHVNTLESAAQLAEVLQTQ